jgi:hypothetical protein
VTDTKPLDAVAATLKTAIRKAVSPQAPAAQQSTEAPESDADTRSDGAG